MQDFSLCVLHYRNFNCTSRMYKLKNTQICKYATPLLVPCTRRLDRVYSIIVRRYKLNTVMHYKHSPVTCDVQSRDTWLLSLPVTRLHNHHKRAVPLAIEDKVYPWQIVDGEGDAFLVIVFALQRNNGVLQPEAQSHPSSFRLRWGSNCCRKPDLF